MTAPTLAPALASDLAVELEQLAWEARTLSGRIRVGDAIHITLDEAMALEASLERQLERARALRAALEQQVPSFTDDFTLDPERVGLQPSEARR